MSELISKKNYTLLTEANCFDPKGDLCKTKDVAMYCLKIEDADKLMELIDSKRSEALIFLCEKKYITPTKIEGGKMKINDLDFRAAMDLLGEYTSSFLDLSPFIKTE